MLADLEFSDDDDDDNIDYSKFTIRAANIDPSKTKPIEYATYEEKEAGRAEVVALEDAMRKEFVRLHDKRRPAPITNEFLNSMKFDDPVAAGKKDKKSKKNKKDKKDKKADERKKKKKRDKHEVEEEEEEEQEERGEKEESEDGHVNKRARMDEEEEGEEEDDIDIIVRDTVAVRKKDKVVDRAENISRAKVFEYMHEQKRQKAISRLQRKNDDDYDDDDNDEQEIAPREANDDDDDDNDMDYAQPSSLDARVEMRKQAYLDILNEK
jgi:hypothetical protein